MIYPNFPLDLTGFFQGKHRIEVLANKMQYFQNFHLHNCILNFHSEQVYLKLQVTNVKNKKGIPKPKEKVWSY